MAFYLKNYFTVCQQNLSRLLDKQFANRKSAIVQLNEAISPFERAKFQ